ncbi:MAG: hypothetical protein E7309_06855 [Butyrivibrio sp.]|jgi:hypothetical protein|nr:hypothetical protein [Butyrivibrio sp.]
MKILLERDIRELVKHKDKKIVLYGAEKLTVEVFHKLKCLDLEVSYVVDNFDDLDDGAVSLIHSIGLELRDIYELYLEKEDCFILILRNDYEKCSKKLESMGFKNLIDFNRFFNAAGYIRNHRFRLDSLIGYGLPAEGCDKNGLKIFGSTDSARRVIAILGGSTSDPCVYEWKSWGECFYNNYLSKDNTALVIGATAGYSSSEELLKLIRDVLPLNPYLVISYSSVNDNDTLIPYENSYKRKLFKKISAMRMEDPYGNSGVEEYIAGVQRKSVKGSEKWLTNQRIMNAVCREFGIRFVCILQPNLITKQKEKKDEEILFYVQNQIKNQREKFSSEIGDCVGDFDFIENGIRWLDGEDGLFYDYCHLNEKGNMIISDKIYDCLKRRKLL